MKQKFKKLLLITLLSYLSQFLYSQEYKLGGKVITKDVELKYKNEVKDLKIECSTTKSAGLKPFVDNSISKYFPYVFNQKGGSCGQAAAVGYIYTYELNCILDRDPKEISDYRFSYLYTWNMVNNGQGMGSDAIDGWSVIKENGAITLHDFNPNSYIRWPNGYKKYLKGMSYGIEEWYKIDASENPDRAIEKMKMYLSNHGNGDKCGGLIYFSANADPLDSKYYLGDSYTSYNDIITIFPKTGAHAMTIAGYDDSIWYDYDGDGNKDNSELGAFICVNSWGNGWGNSHGRFYMPYELVRRPKIDGGCDKYFFTVVPKLKEPQIVFKVLMEHSSRNDIEIEVGIGQSNDSAKPYRKKTIGIMNHQGGDHTLNGKDMSDDTSLEFGIDASFLTKFKHEDNIPTFFLKVKDAVGYGEKGVGKINSFEVYDYSCGIETPMIFKCSEKDISIKGEYLVARSLNKSIYEYSSICDISVLVTSNVLKLKSPLDQNVVVDLLDKESVVETIYSGKLTVGYNEIKMPKINSGEYTIRIKSYKQLFYKRIVL